MEIFPLKGKKTGKTVAYGKVTLNGDIVIDGLRLVEGRNGLFVGMPSRKTTEGNFSDVVFVTTKELKDEIQKKAIEEYNSAGTDSPPSNDEDDDLPF